MRLLAFILLTLVAKLAFSLDPVIPNPVVPNGRITQLHGQYPSALGDSTHIGLDIAGPEMIGGCDNIAVHSFAEGIVEKVVSSLADSPATGYAIMIRHVGAGNRAFFTTYLHLAEAPKIGDSKTLAKAGNKVERGQKIGIMGETGKAFGCHTHFEIKYQTNSKCPPDFSQRCPPLWGGIWKRSKDAVPEINIYGLGDVRRSTEFLYRWVDPVDVFCQFPEGMGDGDRLPTRSGCADLRVVPNSMKLSQKTAELGDTVRFDAIVQNIGIAPSRPSSLRIRLAPRSTAVTRDDPFIADISLPGLASKGTEPIQYSFAIPMGLPLGENFVWTILDTKRTSGQHPHSELNDTATQRLMLVQHSPDLRIQTLRISPYRLAAGESARVLLDIRNFGDKISKPTKINIRITSNPSSVTPADQLLATLRLPPLAPNGRQQFEEFVATPAMLSSGDHYLWVVLDVDSTAGQSAKQEENDKFSKKIQIR